MGITRVSVRSSPLCCGSRGWIEDRFKALAEAASSGWPAPPSKVGPLQGQRRRLFTVSGGFLNAEPLLPGFLQRTIREAFQGAAAP
jgi:hypothetical protein